MKGLPVPCLAADVLGDEAAGRQQCGHYQNVCLLRRHLQGTQCDELLENHHLGQVLPENRSGMKRKRLHLRCSIQSAGPAQRRALFFQTRRQHQQLEDVAVEPLGQWVHPEAQCPGRVFSTRLRKMLNRAADGADEKSGRQGRHLRRRRCGGNRVRQRRCRFVLQRQLLKGHLPHLHLVAPRPEPHALHAAWQRQGRHYLGAVDADAQHAIRSDCMELVPLAGTRSCAVRLQRPTPALREVAAAAAARGIQADGVPAAELEAGGGLGQPPQLEHEPEEEVVGPRGEALQQSVVLPAQRGLLRGAHHAAGPLPTQLRAFGARREGASGDCGGEGLRGSGLHKGQQ
mmetsp:Transcript_152538/g.489190  ORF Transcript_152538/g.489190 Transcript_152538/m.489190 type:complete len:344 (+) Transcript_152538:1401-2432(+)